MALDWVLKTTGWSAGGRGRRRGRRTGVAVKWRLSGMLGGWLLAVCVLTGQTQAEELEAALNVWKDQPANNGQLPSSRFPELPGAQRHLAQPDHTQLTGEGTQPEPQKRESDGPWLRSSEDLNEPGRALRSRTRLDRDSRHAEQSLPWQEKRLTGSMENPAHVVSRQKRADSTELSLLRNEPASAQSTDAVLSRQKRHVVEMKDPILSRERRFLEDNGHTERILSRTIRQERVREDVSDSEAALSRQKRVSEDLSDFEPGLSRQKRFDDDPEPGLSRQKRFDDDTGLSLAIQKRFDDDTEPALSRQKRFDDDTEPALSRQKRFDDDTEPALSRQKRFDDDTEPALARQTQVNENSNDADSEVWSETARTPFTEPRESDPFTTGSQQNRQLLASKEEQAFEDDADSFLSKQEAALQERRQHEPEHKLYHEDLLLRRLKALRMENRRKKKNKESEVDVEHEDSWEQELRIRQDLAEMAIEYGIQRRKERLKNQDPKDMSILMRIKQDAEEILHRRAQEEEYANRDKQDTGFPQTESTKEDELAKNDMTNFLHEKQEREGFFEDKERQNVEDAGKREGRKEKKKSEKAILKLLNLKPAKQKSYSPEPAPDETGATLSPVTAALTTTPSYSDTILRFERLLSENKGRMSRRRRKKIKRKKRALEKGKERQQGGELLKKLDLMTFTLV